MTRLDDLWAMRTDLLARMKDCSSDQNYAVMGRLLTDVLKQIAELESGAPAKSKTGLSDFEKRLAERTGAKGSRRAARSRHIR